MKIRKVRKGQFLVLTSVIILISLMALDKFVQETTFVEAELPEQEFSHQNAFIKNTEIITENTPPARIPGMFELLQFYSQRSASLKFDECFCCGDACNTACKSDEPAEWSQMSGCENVNISSLNDLSGELRISSNTVRIQSDLNLSTNRIE